jgi:hypothetical protein
METVLGIFVPFLYNLISCQQRTAREYWAREKRKKSRPDFGSALLRLTRLARYARYVPGSYFGASRSKKGILKARVYPMDALPDLYADPTLPTYARRPSRP